MGAKLELGILGPVEVRIDDAAAALGGPRQRAVLAVLAIRPNQVVSVDRLIDEIWEEHPPDRAVHTVHVFVSRLRRALAAAGDRRTPDRRATCWSSRRMSSTRTASNVFTRPGART